MFSTPNFLGAGLAFLAAGCIGHAQFIDNFDRPKIEGWFTMVGDGTPKLDFVAQDGFGRMLVDGSTDRYGVYWTLIKRDVSPALDLEKLKQPEYELRVEARVRSSVAPRRVNFMLNTQRTTNFHQHLREYDLADTDWHVISMTTKDFDAVPGDQVFVQFAATDYGPGQYQVDVDYYRADVVRADTAGRDLGEPLMYHPPIADAATFGHHLPVTHDTVVSTEFPEVNFNDWRVEEASGAARILTVGSTTPAILRWDFGALRGAKAAGPGIVELTTCSTAHGGKYIAHWGQDFGEEFGNKIHVIEILAGDPAWDQEKVTYTSLLNGQKPGEVFNAQMVQDIDVTAEPGGKSYVTLPRPVMQRLLDGRTKGLILKPLGELADSFYASEDTQGRGPKLHFSTEKR